ncbi:MAG: pseudouridine-5'-phosphate glycosidase [Oscillospiraceae bacterium]
MGIEKYLDVKPEIAEAVKNGEPVVALESTILSHGFPYPENTSFSKEVEKIVRSHGAVPATTAIIDGKLKVGLSEDELMFMCSPEGKVGKVSRRDIPVYLESHKPGATTVATTMIIAAMAGIKVFATGGIGGVHRGATETMDISADLQELARTPVMVVSAGAKMVLDIGLTLEYLETMGVPVLGFGTDDFPAFYCRKSGFKADYAVKDAAEAAKIAKIKWDLGLQGGIIVGNPIPEEYELDFNYMEGIINEAIKECDEKGIKGKYITPFLLAKIKDLTGGESVKANTQLAYNNCRVAADIACELAKL